MEPDLIKQIDAEKERDLIREELENMPEPQDDDEYGLGDCR